MKTNKTILFEVLDDAQPEWMRTKKPKPGGDVGQFKLQSAGAIFAADIQAQQRLYR